MEILPILSALRRHRMAAALIALEVALSCAILCNAVFMIVDRLQYMRIDSGVAEDELVSIGIGAYAPEGEDASPLVREQLAALRAIPGVRAVAAVSSLPLSRSLWTLGVTTEPGDRGEAYGIGYYVGTPDIVQTLGLRLNEGRGFTDEDAAGLEGAMPKAAVTIIPRHFAQKLWPDQEALGRSFYIGTRQYRVIGVVDHLAAAVLRDDATAEDTALFPMQPTAVLYGSFVLRCTPQDRERVLRDASAALLQVSPGGIITEPQSFAKIRADYFRQDRSMAAMLIGVCVLLLVTTALGIVGLASFWVQSRRRQIGVRRALGARRLDILQYFQIENFVIVTCGILLGMALAYGINFALIQFYELARLPLGYLPVGALLLWLTGQSAVLGPALRAARIPPITAARGA